MFCCNLVNIFPEFIYEKDRFVYTSWISIFLFEVFLMELDFKLYQLVLQFNSFKAIVFPKRRSNFVSFSEFEVYRPLKLDFHLLPFLKLKTINSQLCIFYTYYFSFFKRQIFYFRYKDRVVLTVFGKRNFSELVFSKLLNFIRGFLHFDLTSSSFLVFLRVFNLVYYLFFIAFCRSGVKTISGHIQVLSFIYV